MSFGFWKVEHLRGKQVVGDEAFSCRAPDLLRVHGTRQAQLRQEELRRKEQELVESKLTVHDIGYRGCNFLPVQMLKLYSINLTYHVQPRGLFCLQRRAKKEDEQRRREEEQEAQRRLEEEALRPCKERLWGRRYSVFVAHKGRRKLFRLVRVDHVKHPRVAALSVPVPVVAALITIYHD